MRISNSLAKRALPFWISFATIISTRLLTLLAFPIPTRSPDSSTYFRSHWFNFDLVSFSGHAGRGWVVPLIYSILPNQISVTILQLTVSSFAWIFVIECVSKNLQTKKSKYLGLTLITIFSCSPQLVQHDTALLSTSITNSLLLISLGILFLFKAGSNSTNLFLLQTLILSLLFIQKTSFILLVAPIGVLGIVFIFKNQLRYRVPVTILLIMALLYGGFVGMNVNNTWQVSYSGQTLLWQLGGQSPVAGSFRNYLKEVKAPDCVFQSAPYKNLDLEIGKILNGCPIASHYLKKEFQKDFIHFLMANPEAVIKLASIGFGATATSSASNYGNAVSLLPLDLETIFFGRTYPDLVNTNISDQVDGMNALRTSNLWLISPMFLWVIVSLVLLLQFSYMRISHMFETLCIASSLLSMTIMFVLLPSEWVRQSIASTLIFYVLAIYVFAKRADFSNHLNPDR